MSTLRLVLVDDEDPVRAGLRSALEALPVDTTVVGEAGDVPGAVAVIEREAPDLVLLDIWLGDGTGFDVLDRLKAPANVVFVTAFDHYAVRAFQRGALHYLLKPVSREDLRTALERAREQARPSPGAWQMVRKALADRIKVPTSEGFHVLAPSEILRCASDGNYTWVHLVDGGRFLAARTLKEFEEMLLPHGFMRVHQSHVIDVAQVRMYLHRDGGMLQLRNGDEVPVGAKRKQEVMEVLGRRTEK